MYPDKKFYLKVGDLEDLLIGKGIMRKLGPRFGRVVILMKLSDSVKVKDISKIIKKLKKK